MCAIFEFSDFAQKMWKKIRFKFENSEKFYKGFPCKKKFYGNFYIKWIGWNLKGILQSFFQGGQIFFFSWEFFVNWTQIKFNWGFPFFSRGSLTKNQKEIHWKINPDQIFKYARKKKERKKKKKRKKDLARTVFQS